jgi:hypothetical protein
MPTWATNIIGARYVWLNMGSPPPPKEPTELGKKVAQRITISDAKNQTAFEVGLSLQLESS